MKVVPIGHVASPAAAHDLVHRPPWIGTLMEGYF